MLFNSWPFIFLFLPVTLAGYLLLRKAERTRLASAWLVAASLYFYGYWDLSFLPILIGSTLVNFALGSWLARLPDGRARTALFTLGIAGNLALLGYFKYTNALVEGVDALFGIEATIHDIVLPIGISFYTFQKIAFLSDIWRRRTAELDLLNFLLFVSFFPQLIAGPIVHHREVMPQFAKPGLGDVPMNLAIGFTLFVIGLFKKVVVADQLAQGASPTFDAAAMGFEPDMGAAWSAVLCYSLQIYFDFSAYSDMALGLARMFGIRLPINFASPYKATSIIDFWRRWHITLSRFLRDYLYIPLGGNRQGGARRYLNVFLTMLLGGIWHGAGLNFVLWGAMHGIMIVVNQLWRERRADPGRRDRGRRGPIPDALGTWCGRIATFVLVGIAWVPFRAETTDATFIMYGAMLGLPATMPIETDSFDATLFRFALVALAACWFLPNSYEIMRRYRPGLASPGYPATEIAPSGPPRLLAWRPTPPVAGALALAFVLCLLKLNDISEFIYFQF